MTISDYQKGLFGYMSSDQFLALDDEKRQENIDLFRQKFIFEYPDVDVDLVNKITEEENKTYLRATGRGRVIPKINIVFPNQEEGYDMLSDSEKSQKIEEFKEKIPEIAATNPSQREDTEFFLNQSINQLERINNGEDRNWFQDKASRIGQGFVAGLLLLVKGL